MQRPTASMLLVQRLLLSLLLGIPLMILSGPARADDHPTLADLAWMTGSWAGPIGGGQILEENWIEPEGGSLAALVRSTGNGATSMVELIVIEEENSTLVLRLQQWNPGFEPRTPGPQTLVLDELGARRVSFKGSGASGMRSLTYASPAPDTFTIDVATADGQNFQLELSAR